MPVMKMKESKFGAPADVYIAIFKGIFPMKDDGKPRMGKDGKPMEPGLEWQFEIVEGDFAGQIVGRITSKEPTTKNSCGQLLAGLTGRKLNADDEINPDDYSGHKFKIVVTPGKENPDKTQVTQIIRLDKSGAPAAKTPNTPPPSAVKAPPPPPPTAKPKDAGVPEPHYHVWDAAAGKSERVSGSMIREHVKAGRLAADTACMNDDQSSGWKTIHDFGLDAPF